ncbi:MAG TPA: TlpA family protein disulfide reductase [Bacteroidia bacterium]|nr:TlpA family protein disulfide reductase [Bacteroidia bacterium]
MKVFFTIASLIFCLTGYSQSIRVIKIEELEKRVKNDSDTTYVVNFWATWCAPCVKELPDFDSLTAYTVKEKVKVLLISLDFKEDLDQKVIPFIKKKQIQSEVLLLDELNGNYFIPKISANWSGALPGTWIINNKKNVNRFFEKKITFDFLKKELMNTP